MAPLGVILEGMGEVSGGAGGTGGGVRSLYVHVPFCFHKCHYCDFYSFVDKADQQGAFVEVLVTELRALAPLAGRLETIFVGGGTPSLLRVDLWRRLLEEMEALFGVRNDAMAGRCEFTVECNPETVSAELMEALAAGGVNRVSIGAQSFSDAHLKTLERWHDPANVGRAVALAAEAGIARRSIDLIFAVPGQTVGEWRADLERALGVAGGAGAGLEHLSCYNLTYEPNTAMTKRLERGEFVPVMEETEIEMFRLTRSVLADAGFEAYEVSNFARGAGARCQHNLVYWRQGEWLAAGPSASAHVRGWRWKNTANLGEWMRGVRANGGASGAVDLEPPNGARALSERLMTGLRLSEGVDAGEMLARAAALGAERGLREAAARVVGKGLMFESGGVWRLSEAGVLVGDSVAAEMMAGVRAVK